MGHLYRHKDFIVSIKATQKRVDPEQTTYNKNSGSRSRNEKENII